MPSVIETAKRVIETAEIRDVRLVRASLGTKLRSAAEEPSPEVTISFGADVSEREDERFWVTVGFQMKVFPATDASEEIQGEVDVEEEDENGRDPLVWVNAAFEIAYRVPDEFTPSDEELEAFAEANGVFNAWPFLREFMQSSFTRMGLPPVALGLFRASKDIPETGLATAGEEESSRSRPSQEKDT